MTNAHDCDDEMDAAADRVSEGRWTESLTIVLVLENEEDFVLWCSECGTMLEQEIEGVRTFKRPALAQDILSATTIAFDPHEPIDDSPFDLEAAEQLSTQLGWSVARCAQRAALAEVKRLRAEIARHIDLDFSDRMARVLGELSPGSPPAVQDWEASWRSVSSKLSEYRYASLVLETAIKAAGHSVEGSGFDGSLIPCIRFASNLIAGHALERDRAEAQVEVAAFAEGDEDGCM